MRLPNIIYKYRQWSKPLHKTILTNNEIYFASPSEFNDKQDCRLPIRFDLVSYKMLYKYYYHYARENKEDNPLRFAECWTKNSPLHKLEYQKKQEESQYKELCDIFGVFSVSHRNDNKDLWRSFGGYGTGFCVGFDRAFLENNYPEFQGLNGWVQYHKSSEKPIILPFYNDSERRLNAMVKNVLHLRKKYEKQEEYRYTKLLIKQDYFDTEIKSPTLLDRTIQISSEAYKEIVFGANMSKKHKEEIAEITNSRFPKVTLLEIDRYMKVNRFIV